MLKRIIIASSILLATPGLALDPVAQAVPGEAPQEDLVRVALDTDRGRIVLALDRGRAPVTAANFLRYVEAKRFDGISFYRVMPYGQGSGLIQGGITRDARLLYPPITHEPVSQTGIKHEAGTIAMANAGPGTARADFFILAGPIPAFDGNATNPGFAAFGRVVEGMDVVKTILGAPVDPAKGAGPMKGQMLAQPVVIRTARLVE